MLARCWLALALLGVAFGRRIGHEPTTNRLLTDGTECDEGWTAYDMHCFKAITGVSANYSASSAICKKANPAAVLPSIHSKQENDIMLILTDHTPFWSGLSNMTGNGQGEWSWDDHSAVDFTNWAPGMPALSTGRNYCVWIYEGDGTWSNEPCNLNLGAVLCQV